ncbi:MAG TPA: CPBP family intramembrane glutamic endopeptidase [Actinomycetes bacterium]|nr:CPBP family intramembrane glutamic endopeptidase [Actinomycetes bacterium]
MSSVYARPTGRWGFGDVGWCAIVFLGVIVLSGVLLAGLVVLVPRAFTDSAADAADPVGSWVVVLTQALTVAGMVAWPLLTGARNADGWRNAFGLAVTWRALWVGLGLGVVALIAMTQLTYFTAELLDRDINSAGAEAAVSITGSDAAYVVFLLLIAFGAPFSEELVFRGLIWGAAVKRGWAPWVATLIACVPFAVIHIEPLRVAPLLAAGIVLGLARQFGGLGAAMVAHGVVNVIGVIGIVASG